MEEFSKKEWEDIKEHSYEADHIPYLFKYRFLGWRNGTPPSLPLTEEQIRENVARAREYKSRASTP
jgi:hypothetical protein